MPRKHVCLPHVVDLRVFCVIGICVCVAAGCVFDDECSASTAYPNALLRINKVAKIQWSYITSGYQLLLLLLYFT